MAMHKRRSVYTRRYIVVESLGRPRARMTNDRLQRCVSHLVRTVEQRLVRILTCSRKTVPARSGFSRMQTLEIKEHLILSRCRRSMPLVWSLEWACLKQMRPVAGPSRFGAADVEYRALCEIPSPSI